jgi:rod shape-determining protein MreD
MALWGRAAWAPDVLSIVLVFWTVHQTMRVGIGAAFVFGLMLDVYQGGLLGQHAMAYTVLSYVSIMVHRRLLWFTLPEQTLQVLPLFALVHAVELMLNAMIGGNFPGWWVLMAPVGEALLWPVVSWTLLAPQRRAPDPDDNRPL